MTENSSHNIFPWLCLYLVPGLGNVACKNLIGHFGEADEVFRSPISDLTTVEGIREDVARRIAEKVFAIDPEEELKRIENRGARIIPFTDPSYPGLLREIHDPPVILYTLGQSIPRQQDFVAIVGSRNATDYGRGAAHKIAQGLTENGIGISSGLARGIDSSAHWGCIRGGGFTIAVLGTGVDVLYPRSNERLLGRVLETGAVISEFPMQTAPEPRNFPIRNRIISGISRGVVVVEATRQSGSLITASLALDQGRDVFAIPGSIDSFKSRGPHFLIKQGAKLVENADDILGEIGFYSLHEDPGADADIGKQVIQLEPDEEMIFNCLGPYPTHIDQIIRSVGRAPGEVLSILTRLELMGIINQLAGMMFVKAERS